MEYITRLHGENDISLCLKDIDDDHIKQYLKWYSDDKVNTFTEYRLQNLTYHKVENITIDNLSNKNMRVYDILKKSTNSLIGECSITIQPFQRNAILRVFIADQDCINVSYMSEVLSILTRYSFSELNILNIGIVVNSLDGVLKEAVENMKYLCMDVKQIGVVKETEFVDGKWSDAIHYQLTSNRN